MFTPEMNNEHNVHFYSTNRDTHVILAIFIPEVHTMAKYITLLSVLLLANISSWAVESAEPTLARLCFWVPSERIMEFESAYEKHVVPVLNRHSLVASSESMQTTADSVFARSFAFKTVAEFEEVRKAFLSDSAFVAVQQILDSAFATKIPVDFRIYNTPSGSGNRVPAGAGKVVPAGSGSGHWRAYSEADGLAAGAVRSILQDRQGQFWFGTQGGVSRYDGQTFQTFTKDDELAGNGVSSIIQDREGSLWFGTDGGVSRYDPSASSGQAAWTTFTIQDGLAHNRVRSMLEDREGNFWFGTQGGGVSRYDGETFTTFTTQDGLADNMVRSIIQDREGSLWFGTLGGVSRYDGETFMNFTPQDGLIHYAVFSVVQDREGVLWFGTRRGVSRYDDSTFTTFITLDGLAHNSVRSIFQDREGSLWIGTLGGVSRYDGQTFTTFTTQDGLAHNNVYSIVQDREGALWFGTRGRGVSRYDGETFTNFTTEDGLAHNIVRSVLQDREGVLWFGTSGGGVSRYDGQTFTTFTTQDGLVNNSVFSTFLDRGGSLWFGTFGSGVSRYNGKTFMTLTEEDGLADGGAWSTAQDREGMLWFATTSGASRYNPLAHSTSSGKAPLSTGSRNFTTFTVKDGLARNGIGSIVQDREGSLWFGTNGGGVSRYDDSTFTTITTQDGLAHNDVRAIFQDREGSLWFGTEVGLTRYRQPAPSPPSVFIDAVLADQRYEGVSEIALPSTVALTTFEFHGASFKTRSEAMVYRYRLTGYEEDWQTTRLHRVEYKNLPRGRYAFEVQAVDRDLVYSDTPATLALTVHLPYERIGLISALVLAIGLVGWQTGRVIRRDRRLQEANAAMSDANRKIQLQTERKSVFLASMSHELRTPMNAIKGFTSLVLRREKDLSDRNRENLEKVTQASDHLLAMINDILDLSKIEAGRMDVNPELFDMKALVTYCCATVSPLLEEKPNVTLEQDVADEIEKANTDQGRIRQMLINLLSNAIKFTDSGSVSVKALQEDGHLVLSVSDTGQGIPEDEVLTIFDEYRQVKGSDREHRGTGLGLSITKQFAELLGGTIGVESQVGKGSTFTVRVPVVYEEIKS